MSATKSPEPTEHLIRAAKSGDMEAWSLLDQRYRNVLSLFLRGRIPTGARARFDTEDVLQSAFLSAFKELDSYEYQGPGSFKAWITRILENRLRTRLRQNATQKRDADRDQRFTDRLSSEGTRGARGASTPSELFASAENYARLVEAIGSLPDDLRQVVTLHFLDKKTLAQVAEELEMSETTVGRRVARAVELIHRRLRDPDGSA